MTLDTTVRTSGPIDLEQLRTYCGLQLGGVDLWIAELSDVALDRVLLTPLERCVGGAHLSILYRPAGEDARDVEVGWVTGWYSISPAGEPPLTFHRRLAGELGGWLLGFGLQYEIGSCAAAP